MTASQIIWLVTAAVWLLTIGGLYFSASRIRNTDHRAEARIVITALLVIALCGIPAWALEVWK